MVFEGIVEVFHGFWLVSMVFEGSFMIFHGFWLVSMVFQGGFMVFHGFCLVSIVFKVVLWFFMIFGWFPLFFNLIDLVLVSENLVLGKSIGFGEFGLGKKRWFLFWKIWSQFPFRKKVSILVPVEIWYRHSVTVMLCCLRDRRFTPNEPKESK